MKRSILLLTIVSMLLFPALLKGQEVIPMQKDASGLYKIPCEVNGLKLTFILDTGATNVVLSSSEGLFMLKNGYLSSDDILGSNRSILADGSIAEGTRVRIKDLKIGTQILHDIEATISDSIDASLLLGQSVLSKLGHWSFKDGDLILNNHKAEAGQDPISLQAKQLVEQYRRDKDFSKLEDILTSNSLNDTIKDKLAYEIRGELMVNGFEEEAKAYAKKGYELGILPLYHIYGIYLYFDYHNPKEAYRVYCEGAERGDKGCLRSKAGCLISGDGVTKDLAKGVKILESMAADGDVQAIDDLCADYCFGIPGDLKADPRKTLDYIKYFFEEDKDRANAWKFFAHYELKNYDAARWILEDKDFNEKETYPQDLFYSFAGQLYEKGLGGYPDINKAKEYYNKLINMGMVGKGFYMLGELYGYTTNNNTKYFEYMTLSANNNYSPAFAHLAHCYQYGVGTYVDKRLALEWKNKAIKSGYYEATDFDF